MASNRAPPPTLSAADFDGTVDGRPIRLHTLDNGRGLTVRFVDLGAKVQQILAPDRDGLIGDVALGYASLEGVLAGEPGMGAFIGRYANRIGGGRLPIGDRIHRLPVNNAGNTLHGGPRGSSGRVFDVRRIDAATAELRLRYTPQEDGFPGTVESRVVYRVTPDNAFVIEYEATTDATTVASMTSHVYFNLAGHDRADASTAGAHTLMLPARFFTPVDPTQLPTGEIRAVAGTAMDFTRPQRIDARQDDDDEQLRHGKGYDHNWVIDKPPGVFGLVARLADPLSGRVLEVSSTEPGLVFYAGNQLDGRVPRDVGKDGVVYRARAGVCLEPAGFPDAPNRPHFPSTLLRPGERYAGTTVFSFSTMA